MRALSFMLTLLLSLSSFAQEGTAGISLMESSTNNEGYFSNWRASFFSIGSLTQQQIEKGSGSFSSYNYVGLNYRITKTTRFSIRPVFYFNTAGYNKYNDYEAQSVEAGDLHLVYSDYEIASFGDFEVSTSFKTYLPTSEYSQQTRLIAKFRPETFIKKRVGRFSSVTYVLKPDLYFQSQTVHKDETVPQRADGSYVRDPRRTTQMAGLEHYIEFNASMSKSFSIKPAVGFIEDWYHSSAAEGLDGAHHTNAKLALAFDFRFARRLTLTLGFENKPRIANRRDELAFFRPEDNGAFLMTNAAL